MRAEMVFVENLNEVSSASTIDLTSSLDKKIETYFKSIANLHQNIFYLIGIFSEGM